MIIPTNTNKNTPVDIVTIKKNTSNYDVETKVNLDILDNMDIKREVYYKMNYIMKYLENHWAIKKKRKGILF